MYTICSLTVFLLQVPPSGLSVLGLFFWIINDEVQPEGNFDNWEIPDKLEKAQIYNRLQRLKQNTKSRKLTALRMYARWSMANGCPYLYFALDKMKLEGYLR